MYWVLGRSFSMQYTQMWWQVDRCKHVYSILLLQSDAWSKWVQDIFHEYEVNLQGSLSDVDLFVSKLPFLLSRLEIRRGWWSFPWTTEVLVHVDGELSPALQESFLSSLNGAQGIPTNNRQPTTDGSRYLISCWMLDVRSFRKAEYDYKNHPFDSTCHIDGLWGWSLAVLWGLGRFRKTVDVVKRCRTKWFDEKFDSIASVLNWASINCSPYPKPEYKSAGIWRFWKVPCKFHAQLIDSNLISWLPWKS